MAPSNLNHKCEYLKQKMFLEGPGPYSIFTCRIKHFSESNDCVGCTLAEPIPGTTQEEMLKELEKLGY